MFKFIATAIVVLLTTLAAVSADLYVSSGGSGLVGNYGSVSVSGRGISAGGMWTPNGGIYAGANTRNGAASVGIYDGHVTSASIRTSDVRGHAVRTSSGYAGSLGVGARVYAPNYYYNGYGYGPTYGTSPRIMNAGPAVRTSSRGYTSSADYLGSRW